MACSNEVNLMDNYDDEYEFENDEPLTDNDRDDDSYGFSDTKPVTELKQRGSDRGDLINRFAEPRKKRVKSKADFRPLLLAIGLAAIIVIIATCTIVYNVLNPKLKVQEGTQAEDLAISESSDELSDIKDISDIVPKLTVEGVIQKVDTYENSIVFISLEDDKNYSVTIKGSTFLKDRYNNEIMLNDFAKGEVVTFVYDNSDRLAYVMKSSGGFETGEVSVEIDSERKIITDKTNNCVYYYDDKLISCYKDASIDLSKITSTDKVTLRGYKDTLYYINVTQGHGTLEITNKDKIKNGTIDVDKTIVGKALSEVSTLQLSEGQHNIVVKGDNCEVYIKDIEVEANEIYPLNLSEVQIKQGVLLIKANVSDYLLYVNNNIELSREPLILDYGAYSIKIEKEGYKTYENQIVLDRAQYTIDAELEENIPMGKLTVNTTPEYADVYVDNTRVGIAPLTVQVAQGTHNLTVKKDGYKDVTFNGIQITNIESQYNITLQENQPVISDTSAAGTADTGSTSDEG